MEIYITGIDSLEEHNQVTVSSTLDELDYCILEIVMTTVQTSGTEYRCSGSTKTNGL